MPTGDEMFKLFRGLDLAYKSELLLSQIQTVLIWTGFTESFLQLGLFCAFCAAPTGFGGVWFMIFHIPRALAGFYLVYKLPRSHDAIDSLDFDNVHESEHSVDTYLNKIQFSLSVVLINAGDECKKWLLIYSGATALCFLLDCTNFVVAY